MTPNQAYNNGVDLIHENLDTYENSKSARESPTPSDFSRKYQKSRKNYYKDVILNKFS